ncbi:hypothetical protein BJ322DRAFT_1021482 [Thelephora terrestris]|uniref:Uncharacterized protein n=1 Tax=Thelephora terrestris TaxID=56493 RepID=A0A9P6L6W1_9AGAM|nr:hypothetical protein BJ322DRAFT_1021482 [Thelephora terrestris]
MCQEKAGLLVGFRGRKRQMVEDRIENSEGFGERSALASGIRVQVPEFGSRADLGTRKRPSGKSDADHWLATSSTISASDVRPLWKLRALKNGPALSKGFLCVLGNGPRWVEFSEHRRKGWEVPGSGRSRVSLNLPVMPKRERTAPKGLVKESEAVTVEDVRVWDVSTSERTGRVSASRRMPSTIRENEEGGEVDVEEAGTLADSESPPEMVERRRRQRCLKERVKENDSTRMDQWLQHRQIVLDEMLRLDGLGDALDGPESSAKFRCKDCFEEVMRCSACMVSSHRNLPLHRLQSWNDGFFESETLENLGLVVNLGHHTISESSTSIDFYTSIMQKTDNCGRSQCEVQVSRDLTLVSGLAYFVNAAKFEAHLAITAMKGTFVNMDYIFLSTVKNESVKIIKISYDIACRWSIKLRRRLEGYSEDLQFPEDKFTLEFFIPKFHLPAHGSSCHTKYSFNYRPGVGRTHGENIESGWAHTNPAAVSTREMGGGARHSASMGIGVAGIGGRLSGSWEDDQAQVEKDFSHQNPYQVTERASNFNSRAKRSTPSSRNVPQHKLSPFSFVRMGLELEDKQQQVIALLRPRDSERPTEAGSKSAGIPELWPLFLPSHLSQDDRSSCYTGIDDTECTLRLAQVQDNLVDLRRLRRTLRSLRTYFRSNVIGEGQKTQTKSRTAESGVVAHQPNSNWRQEYLELADKDNRGPGKEVEEQASAMVVIRWREPTVGGESDLLQEEMRRVVAFLEWKSMWWGGKVGSRFGSVTADLQHGINGYARKQASTHHELAVSLAKQWIPHLLAFGLDRSSDTLEPIGNPLPDKPPQSGTPTPTINKLAPSVRQTSTHTSGDESDAGNILEVGDHDEGENSEGPGVGFEYDDDYMT